MCKIKASDYEHLDTCVVDKNKVEVLYFDGQDIITVNWFRDTDNNFDLDVYVSSSSRDKADCFEVAIREGETNDNDYLDLYLLVRDTVNREDVKDLADASVKYKIVGWTGRQLFNDQEFDTIDEAWAAIDEYIANLEFEEAEKELGEYLVVEV